MVRTITFTPVRSNIVSPVAAGVVLVLFGAVLMSVSAVVLALDAMLLRRVDLRPNG